MQVNRDPTWAVPCPSPPTRQIGAALNMQHQHATEATCREIKSATSLHCFYAKFVLNIKFKFLRYGGNIYFLNYSFISTQHLGQGR